GAQRDVIGAAPQLVAAARHVVPRAGYDVHVTLALGAVHAFVLFADHEDFAVIADAAKQGAGHMRAALARRTVALRRRHVLPGSLRPKIDLALAADDQAEVAIHGNAGVHPLVGAGAELAGVDDHLDVAGLATLMQAAELGELQVELAERLGMNLDRRRNDAAVDGELDRLHRVFLFQTELLGRRLIVDAFHRGEGAL